MAFEQGVVLFFRQILPDNSLARAVHPNGRDVQIRTPISHAEDYVVLDSNREPIGIYPRDYIACILPLIPEVPKGATN